MQFNTRSDVLKNIYDYDNAAFRFLPTSEDEVKFNLRDDVLKNLHAYDYKKYHRRRTADGFILYCCTQRQGKYSYRVWRAYRKNGTRQDVIHVGVDPRHAEQRIQRYRARRRGNRLATDPIPSTPDLA